MNADIIMSNHTRTGPNLIEKAQKVAKHNTIKLTSQVTMLQVQLETDWASMRLGLGVLRNKKAHGFKH